MSNGDAPRNDGEEADSQVDPEVDPQIDPGLPVTELAAFEQDVSAKLIGRVRRAIQRRATTAHLTSFAFHLPMVLLKEFWLALLGQFDSKKVDKDARNEGKAS